ncbi:hypothetical protein CTheo_7851 [Ceratobasidium theobromae]|uniref:Uncharacterized protein n=1 Tax=Ceratobasidium theobromae TaxID=1582974 RepID=A0A5N5QBE0_9AGAM|nr:hypothetical protein CTheo_7851 [Ceratobasidium theobromae]
MYVSNIFSSQYFHLLFIYANMPKDSGSKSKASKLKESEASRAEKRNRTNQHKAAKVSALAKVQVADLESDSEESNNEAADNNNEPVRTQNAPKEVDKEIPRAYRSNCNHYAHIPNKDGVYTRWSVLEKPLAKDAGKNWNIREHMGLDGDEDARNLYNDIVSFIRNHTQAETQDMVKPQWKDISSAIKERVNIKALNRFGYLLRFKHNWATEEIMRRNLRNTRDTKSRINKAGGHSRWKEQERTKREARKSKAGTTTQADSAPQAPGPSQVVPQPTQKPAEACNTEKGSKPTEPATKAKEKGDENTKEQVNEKGKKRALPPPESDHEDLEGTHQPKTSIKTKRRRIDDSSDQEEDVPLPDHSEPTPNDALDDQMEALKRQMEALKAKKLALLPPSPPQSEDSSTHFVKPKPRPKAILPPPPAPNSTSAMPRTSPPRPVPTTLPPTPEPSIPEPTEVGPSHAPSPSTQLKGKKATRPKKTATTRKLKEELIEAAEVESSSSVAPSTRRSMRQRN